jgi:hypothetical protein
MRIGMEEIGRNKWLAKPSMHRASPIQRRRRAASFTAGSTG